MTEPLEPLRALADRIRSPLVTFLQRQRWYGAKGRTIQCLDIDIHFVLGNLPGPTLFAVPRLRYTDGQQERYAVPLTAVPEHRAALDPRHIVANVALDGARYVVCDALALPSVRAFLLELVRNGGEILGSAGTLRGFTTRRGAEALAGVDAEQSTYAALEQSNSALLYPGVFLKLFRRVVEGPNPDLELTCYLTDIAGFAYVPPAYGGLELVPAGGGEPWSVALVQEAVAVEQDAWTHLLELLRRSSPAAGTEALGFIDAVAVLTARLHRALGQAAVEPFAAVACRSEDVRRLVEHVRRECHETLRRLRHARDHLEPATRNLADELLETADRLLASLDALDRFHHIAASLVRIHGDYHLGQVLVGRDRALYVVDFEGEPARSLAERRSKELVVKDVAGMLRSIDYAAQAVACDDPHRAPELQQWALTAQERFWRTYRYTLGPGRLLPADEAQARALLTAYVLQKACYELRYELDNRPEWVRIALAGLNRISKMRSPLS